MNNKLQKFIRETLRQVEANTAGYLTISDVDSEIAIAKPVKKDGGIEVKMLGAGREGKTEKISKVKFIPITHRF